ncbi:MAG: DUF3631 domain-containing protein [Sutterella sp.]|nr:DUF3631 domain-containing protein [Sutterella sp.]
MTSSIIAQTLSQDLTQSDSLNDFLKNIRTLPRECHKTEINKCARTFDVQPSLVQVVHDYFYKNESAIAIPEPSEEERTATQLAKILHKALRKYVHCRPHESKALVLWILQTWFVDYVKYVPYLLIDSPEPACGKSQTLTFLEQTCRKAALIPSLTAAVLTRIMTSSTPPTLLIDEADYKKQALDLCRDFINGGYQRSGKAIKADLNNQRDIIQYNAFGNKAFAGIDLCQIIAPTVTSRSIVIHLKRRETKDDEIFVNDMALATGKSGWEKTRRCLRRMENDYSAEFESAYLDPSTPIEYPEGIRNSRSKQIWRGIFVLAYLELNKHNNRTLLNWAQEAMSKTQLQQPEYLTTKERFLKNVKEIVAKVDLSFISTHAICDALNENPEWGWCELNNSKGISVVTVGRWLNSYDLISRRDIYMGKKSSGFYVNELRKFLEMR